MKRRGTGMSVRPTAVQGLEARRLLAAPFFHVPVQLQGETNLTLQPVESVAPGQATRVGFGVPFPRGFVPATAEGISKIRVLDGAGAEQAVNVTMLTPWRDLGKLTDLGSVRSALVQLDVSFPDSDGDGDADPVPLKLEWGRAARAVPDLAAAGVRDNWVQVDDASYPASANVFEPPAYAVFRPEWYGQALIKSRLEPLGTYATPEFATYDADFPGFGKTAVNDVDPRVTPENRINYLTDYEPWLYDRAMTLYQLAFRSGSFQFVREAHRAAQFYANHINAGGYFDLKPDDDMKYTYGESIAANYWLTGDPRLPDVHRRIIPPFDTFQARYEVDDFWTERHAGFKLLGYVSGYELLGDAAIGQKAKDAFSAYVDHQNNPPAGAPNNGLLMHRSVDHGEGDTEWIASPWMTTLLVEAVERYYIHSGDPRVPSFVTRVADGVNHVGDAMYYDAFESGVRRLIPYYLAGPGLTPGQHDQDPYADIEHAVDVSKIFALAYYFSRAGGAPNAEYLGRFRELSESANEVFQYWVRPAGPASGRSVYRLSPPRKFGWWFLTTADNDWLVLGQGAGQRASVVGRHVFYNDSAYDGHTAGADVLDDGAVDGTKAALLPGQSATIANVTGYVKGINGVMVDVAGLPQGDADFGPTDLELLFGISPDLGEWVAAGAPAGVSVRRGAGVDGSDRVTLVWAGGAVRGAWLQVTVKASSHSGLATPDVFYFGNLPGDAGAGDPEGETTVGAEDLAAVRRRLGSPAGIATPYDFNRDGEVDTADLFTVRVGMSNSLPLLQAPSTIATATASPRRSVARRTTWAASVAAEVLG